jgi:nucleoside-diphosphate-sugar epimerase
MRILVTGSEGYIGMVLTPMLVEEGQEVVGLDTGFYREARLYHSEVERSPVSINKDVRHISMDDLNGFEAVVHLAELSDDPLGQFNLEITYEINHLGGVQLAQNSGRPVLCGNINGLQDRYRTPATHMRVNLRSWTLRIANSKHLGGTG